VSIVVIGLNHTSAPLELLERLSVREDDLIKSFDDLMGRENISEVVVLSTCNRTEVYAVAERFHGAYEDIRSYFSDRSFLTPDQFADDLYVRYDDEAIGHLFRVTSGLDSAVLGESEIMGQVKSAWDSARLADVCGPVLNHLFRHAVVTGKRARTETGIARNITSVSQAAVAMADDRLGGLAGRQVMVVGAGDMAEGMLASLAERDVHEIVVANRTAEKAAELAERVGGRAIPLVGLDVELSTVDLLLTGTGATSTIVDYADLANALVRRTDRPLVIVDVAVPRDVDPSAGEIDGVTLLDMDDLGEFAARGRRERDLEVSSVEAIIEHEVKRFGDDRSARGVAPLVASLHREAEAIRQLEVEHSKRVLSNLSPEERAAVDALTKRLVAKLIHRPTISVKDAAGTPKGDRLADSLRDLYDL
jgi:glutamyl-tRNA reductase